MARNRTLKNVDGVQHILKAKRKLHICSHIYNLWSTFSISVTRHLGKLSISIIPLDKGCNITDAR